MKIYKFIIILLICFSNFSCDSKPPETRAVSIPDKVIDTAAAKDTVQVSKPVFTFDTTNMYVPRRKPNWPRYEKLHIVYDSIVTRYAAKFDIDKKLVQAIICWESNWTAGGTNASNCVGLMQVMGGSTNPARNVNAGCSIYHKYQAQMRTWFSKHFGIELTNEDLIKVALTAYNRGCGGARKYYRKHVVIENGNYKIEHSGYAKSVWWIYYKLSTRCGK